MNDAIKNPKFPLLPDAYFLNIQSVEIYLLSTLWCLAVSTPSGFHFTKFPQLIWHMPMHFRWMLSISNLFFFQLVVNLHNITKPSKTLNKDFIFLSKWKSFHFVVLRYNVFCCHFLKTRLWLCLTFQLTEGFNAVSSLFCDSCYNSLKLNCSLTCFNPVPLSLDTYIDLDSNTGFRTILAFQVSQTASIEP